MTKSKAEMKKQTATTLKNTTCYDCGKRGTLEEIKKHDCPERIRC